MVEEEHWTTIFIFLCLESKDNLDISLITLRRIPLHTRRLLKRFWTAVLQVRAHADDGVQCAPRALIETTVRAGESFN